MQTNKDFIALKAILKNLKIARSTFQKYIKADRKKFIDEGLIIQSNGKTKTLYNIKILDIIKKQFKKADNLKAESEPEIEKLGKDDNQLSRQKDRQIDKSVDSNRQLENDLKIEFYKDKIAELKNQLKEKNGIITENRETIKNKDDFIENLTNRHDTIILTMSKQLEALNNKMMLLEDKANHEPEGKAESVKNVHITDYSLLATRAVIFAILIIVYIKVLYI